jgi:hypothetical protein
MNNLIGHSFFNASVYVATTASANLLKRIAENNFRLPF